ncbi:hypothetical protein [Actinomycetospora sp. NBRC 106378]|uniref:hypothetical protein n=1 Tax=Actinomycetospora sp. NBRC 106378 TaxID=3032208 RepID=UPI0024A1076B|nr:hypothetical protein [Actinomycetospora sp. NBRC 106378]GLZ50782.1 hypothetical protein Acsp07_03990 [Actinomycetospora sp. NBRC 106378]
MTRRAPARRPPTLRRPVDSLGGVRAPVTPAGVVLGADAAGEPVSLAVLRPVGTRIVVLGAFHLARQIALRTVAQGARLAVTTGRAAAWEPIARAADDPDRVRVGADVDLADPDERTPGDTDTLLTVRDRGAAPVGPGATAAPWRTALLVLPSLTPAVADAADDADVVLLGRMPPQEADLATRLWRLTDPMAETLRTLPDHGVVALGRNLWRRLDLVTADRESALLGPVRRA